MKSSACPTSLIPTLAIAALADACGEPAPGALEVRIYGEDFIEKGIPADAFSDGWAVQFEKFLVSVSDVSAASGHGAAAFTATKTRVFDLARPTPWPDSRSISPPTSPP